MVDEGRVVRLLRGISFAQHVASSEDFGAPDSNAGALRLLCARGVIAVAVAERLALAVGFRNVLVHQYAQVDDDIVRDAAHRLDEFEQFVVQVSAWLADQPR